MAERTGMKICHITSMHDWDDDRIYQRACVGLADQGHEVYLIATDTPDEMREGVHFIELKKRSGLKRRWRSSREAYQKALRLHADVYHFHDPDLLPWMYLLGRKGRRVIYDVHENYAERVQNASAIPAFLKPLVVKLWRWFECFCARPMAGLVTTTPTMQELFEKVEIPKVAISNTPYLKALSSTELNREKLPFTIYTSGSHSDKRNCMQSVEALPAIVEAVPEARMIFVGRYDPPGYGDRLNKRARELGVENHLEIEGMLPWKENFQRTAAMEVGLVFYEDNLNNRVTIPNRLFEYMYAGVAVVGEDFPEIRRVVGESKCGFLVNSSRPGEIARAIVKVLTDSKLLEEFQQNGIESVKDRWSFENELTKLIRFYLTVACH